MSDAAAGRLSAQEQVLLERGVGEFNRGLFYECHDTLEDLWTGLRGEARSFVQGLIQIAVGFYHLGNANHTGAARLLGRGLDRLSPYPPGYAGLQTDALRSAAERWRANLLAGGPLPAEPPPSIGVGRRAG